VPARPVLLLSAALAAGAVACDPAAWLGGALHFEEIGVDEALRRAAVESIELVQVRRTDAREPFVPGARVRAPDQELPDPDDFEERPIFVIGDDDGAVRRFAARLVRAGFRRVIAVRGGVDPWLARAP
jgi:rhodanese-related sulfurtransferase